MRCISLFCFTVTVGLSACIGTQSSGNPVNTPNEQVAAVPPKTWSVTLVESIGLSHQVVRLSASSTGVIVNGRTLPQTEAQHITNLFLAINWEDVRSSSAAQKPIGASNIGLRLRHEGTTVHWRSIAMLPSVTALYTAVRESMMQLEPGTTMDCTHTPPRPKCIPDHSVQCAQAYTPVWAHELNCTDS